MPRAWNADELGLAPDDWREIAWGEYLSRQQHRWKALKALWGSPIKAQPRDRRKGWTVYDGYERNRDEDWTLWRCLLATLAIILDRQERGDGGWVDSVYLAFWDAADTYGGYDIMRLQLGAGARISIFSDGECLM